MARTMPGVMRLALAVLVALALVCALAPAASARVAAASGVTAGGESDSSAASSSSAASASGSGSADAPDISSGSGDEDEKDSSSSSESSGSSSSESSGSSSESSGSSSSGSVEDPDVEEDEGDADDEDGKPVVKGQKEKRRSGKNGRNRKSQRELEREDVKKAVASAGDCSVPQKNSTCGSDKNPCSSLGKCQKTSFKCDGKFRTEFFQCVCPDNRRGEQCEHDAVTKHKWNCQDKNLCGGRGQCVKLRTETTNEGFLIHHGCACDEGFGGPGCHLRSGVTISETVGGELVNSVPNNGGYFAFLQLFRDRVLPRHE